MFQENTLNYSMSLCQNSRQQKKISLFDWGLSLGSSYAWSFRLKRCNGAIVTRENVQKKEGAVVCFDTVLGSFQTFQNSLILPFFSSITRTLWIWTTIDLGQFSSGTGNVQKREKSRVFWRIALSHILKYASLI